MLGLGIEEVLCELKEDINEQGLPPGFRFHPTDEELITFYLASQVYNNASSFSPSIKIAQVDLNRCEPWDLPDVAKMGEREWYFFSIKDRKYPAGLRTNRATETGYWKATGKDREIHKSNNVLVGMKKTLVFYKGRAPRGEKTRWVMHEYRLDGQFSCHQRCKEEWVICRIYHKIKERKPPTFQGQHISSYFLGSSSSSSPPPIPATNINPNHPLFSLLDSNPDPVCETSFQNPNFPNITTNNHNQDICFPMNGLQLPSHVATYNPNKKGQETNHPSLIKSFLSNQGCTTLEEEHPPPTAITISEQCKTGANFSPLPVGVPTHYANLPWSEQHHQSDFNGMDFSSLGFLPLRPTANHTSLIGASTNFDVKRAFESVASVSGESWHPLVI